MPPPLPPLVHAAMLMLPRDLHILYRVRRAFEPIFEKYEVDVYLSGHVHTYERSFPVVDNTVRFASTGGNDGVGSDGGGGPVFEAASKMLYEEPAAPVHIVNGAGGNIEVPLFFCALHCPPFLLPRLFFFRDAL